MGLKENIKKYRKDKGLTQKQLSLISEVSYSFITKLESGEQSNPSFETLEKIAAALEISSAKLLDMDELIEDDTTVKSINSLFDSFITNIITTKSGLEYEIKIPELEIFRIDTEEFHSLERKVIEYIKYQLYQIGTLKNLKEGE